VGTELLHADGQKDSHGESNSGFSQFREHTLKSYTSHTCKIGVINDMGYDIRSTGVNVVVRVKLKFHGFHAFTWDRRTEKHSLTCAKTT
jgi:hypothetical protein